MVIGDLRNRDKMRRGIDHYRDGFRPSVWAPEPYVVVSGTIAVAGTPEEARRLLIPEAWSMAHSRTHGTFPPLPPAERVEALTMTREGARLLRVRPDRPHRRHRGAGRRTSWRRCSRRPRREEVLVTTSTYDREALVDSYRRLAPVAGSGLESWGLPRVRFPHLARTPRPPRPVRPCPRRP